MSQHHETRVLPYTALQMYTLVADVESYPKFLPWTAAARVRKTSKIDGRTEMLADLVISFKVFREKFGSRVILDPAALEIDTSYIDGPFKHMESKWMFRDVPDGCEVTFRVDFEFKNRLLQSAAGLFFFEAMQRIVQAFERYAAELYGSDDTAEPPSMI